MGIHPFALSIGLSGLADQLKNRTEADVVRCLKSVNDPGALVEMNALKYIWPTEFDNSKICFVTGTDEAPVFTCFSRTVSD